MNARFWVFEGTSWCKLTLRPGQSLVHYAGGPCEEGYSREVIEWHYDGLVVTEEINYDGRDCDGRTTRNYLFQCWRGLLQAVPAEKYRWNYWSQTDFEVQPSLPARPEWEKVRERQRDYTAESMGY